MTIPKTFSPRENIQIRNCSGPYFTKFGLNTRKYGPEKAPYLDAFHTMFFLLKLKANIKSIKS